MPERPGAPSASFDLTDRVAIVTGGSRGIGLAIAKGFAAHGAKVVVASRKADACAAAAKGPVGEYTPEAWAKSLDVNLRGPVFLTRYALPHLRRSVFGASVINVLSAGVFLRST